MGSHIILYVMSCSRLMALKRMGIVQDYEVNMFFACVIHSVYKLLNYVMIYICICCHILRKSAHMLWQLWELEGWGVSLQKCSPDVALVR